MGRGFLVLLVLGDQGWYDEMMGLAPWLGVLMGSVYDEIRADGTSPLIEACILLSCSEPVDGNVTLERTINAHVRASSLMSITAGAPEPETSVEKQRDTASKRNKTLTSEKTRLCFYEENSRRAKQKTGRDPVLLPA